MDLKPFRLAGRQKLIAIPADDDIRTSLPGLPQIEIDNTPLLLVRHEPHETVVLRSLGYDVPSPILSHYDFPSPPGEPAFHAQKQTAAMMSLNPRAYVLNELGTGKTRSALWAWDYLNKLGLAGKLLVLAPLSTLRFTWGREIIATLPTRSFEVLHGTRAQRHERLANDSADIYICNHDGLKTVLEAVGKRLDIDTVVVDELAVYRNNSARSKQLRKLVNVTGQFRNVWGMTGAPIPNAPTDVWGEAMIVTPERVPKFFMRLRDEMMVRVSEFKWLPKSNARERAFSILQPSVRFTLDDVVELPACVERFVDIEQTPEQTAVYRAILKFCHAAHEKGDITAANAGAAMSKLLQISLGYVYTRERGVAALPNTHRLEALLDAVNGTERKLLVFAGFKHALEGVADALTKGYIEHAVVSGDTPATQRGEIFHLFQNTNKFKVLAAHPQCVSHGLTLTAADTVVWMGPITSLETYEQANRRITRVGQKHRQQVLHFQGTDVERHVYRLLRNKKTIQSSLLDLFAAATDC